MTSQPGARLVCGLLVLAAAGCQSMHKSDESAKSWDRMRAVVKTHLASDHLDAGHVGDASDALREAEAIEPADPQVALLRARIDLSQGRADRAEQVLRAGSFEGPQRGQAQYLLGVICEQRRQWSEALTHFTQAAADDPSEAAYVASVARMLLQLGRADDAERELRSCEARLGWSTVWQAQMAEVCEQQQKWSEAGSLWRRLDGASPDGAALARAAADFRKAGRWHDAADAYAELIERTHDQRQPGERVAGDPTAGEREAAARLGLAACLLELGALVPARQEILLVLDADSRNPEALNLLAQALALQGEFGAAYQTARQVLVLDPTNVSVLESCAAYAARAGRAREARALAQALLLRDAENVIAKAVLATP